MGRLLIVEDNHELASLMVAAAKSRGHGVHVVFTGEDALAALAPDVFDAAIVDLLLPDIRGSEVLLALRATGVPSIAVSGIYRGDRFAREATQVHGALAFFEKPFELAGLLDSVERLCHLPPVKPVSTVEEEDTLDLEELEPLLEDDFELDVAEDLGGSRAPTHEDAEFDFGDLNEDSPAPAPLALGATEDPTSGAEEPSWEAELPPAPPRRALPPDWSLSGALGEMSVARLLGAYYQARHEGELQLQQGPVVKVVTFEAGRVVGAVSNLGHERFGRLCVRRGAMDDDEFPAVAALASEIRVPVGEAMVRLGILTPERRNALLEEQAKEIVWSALGWTHGDYGFSARRRARPEGVVFSLFPGALVLDGVMNTESLVGLQSLLPEHARLFPTADSPYTLHELALTATQRTLLASADGSKTVADLVTLTDLAEREVLGSLRAFQLLGLLERREEPPPSRRITFGL